MTAGEVVTSEPALVYTLHNLLRDGRLLDALGAYWLTQPCGCGKFGRGDGYSVVTPCAGLQLNMCGGCGRTVGKDRLVPPTPYAKDDVVFWHGLLWLVVGDPGPTGAVILRVLDGDDGDTMTAHVLELNRED